MTGDDEPQDAPEQKSGFTSWAIGFEPGQTPRNILIGLLYVIFWPIGFLVLFVSAVVNWRRTGLLPKAFVSVLVLAMLSFVVLVALAPSTPSSSEPVQTSPEDDLNRWMDQHENLESKAVSEYNQGLDYWDDEQYSAAMVDFEDSEEAYVKLANQAGEKARDYESGSRGRFLFGKLESYYHAKKFEARYSADAAFEMSQGNTVEAQADLEFVRSSREEAREHMQTLREEMDWE